jgi:hypothetical protein
MASKETMSSPYVGHYELAGVAFTTTNLIAASPEGTIFGQKIKYVDPICSFLDLLLDRKLPMIVKREIIPGNPDTVEPVDIRTCLFDDNFFRGCLEFKRSNSVVAEMDNYTKMVTDLGKTEEIDIDDTPYAEDDLVEEEENDE